MEWFATTFFAIFQNPVGLELSGVAAFAFLVGCIAMVSVKRQTLAILIFPLPVTLLAASVHKYPFNGRLLLFAVPAFLIPIAEGVEYIRCQTSVQAPAVGACLIGVLFFYPLLLSSYHLFKPSLREEIKPVLNYFQSHVREGDVLIYIPTLLPRSNTMHRSCSVGADSYTHLSPCAPRLSKVLKPIT